MLDDKLTVQMCEIYFIHLHTAFTLIFYTSLSLKKKGFK
jgi:hypothetical protein